MINKEAPSLSKNEETSTTAAHMTTMADTETATAKDLTMPLNTPVKVKVVDSRAFAPTKRARAVGLGLLMRRDSSDSPSLDEAVNATSDLNGTASFTFS